MIAMLILVGFSGFIFLNVLKSEERIELAKIEKDKTEKKDN